MFRFGLPQTFSDILGCTKQNRTQQRAPAFSGNAAQSAEPGSGQDAELEAAARMRAQSGGTTSTRSSQYDKLPIALSTPQTGGNIDERDLAPPTSAFTFALWSGRACSFSYETGAPTTPSRDVQVGSCCYGPLR